MVNQSQRIGSIVGPGLGYPGEPTLDEAIGETRPAAEDITAGDPLRINASGQWARCDTFTYETASAVAVAFADATTGNDLFGLYIGRMDLAGSIYDDNEALFVASDGTITNVATTIVGEFFTRIGKGPYTGVIFVQCEEPVEVT